MIARSSASRAGRARPSMLTVPEEGAVSPARICISVVLPPPSGPTRATTPASGRLRETSFKALRRLQPDA